MPPPPGGTGEKIVFPEKGPWIFPPGKPYFYTKITEKNDLEARPDENVFLLFTKTRFLPHVVLALGRLCRPLAILHLVAHLSAEVAGSWFVGLELLPGDSVQVRLPTQFILLYFFIADGVFTQVFLI